MQFATREEFEKAVEIGQAFKRMELTEDYAKSLGAWIENEYSKKRELDVDLIKPPHLEEAYWMIQGQKAMLYDLLEQIQRWRLEGSQTPESVPEEAQF